MPIKPEFAFDLCWEVYAGAREVLETKRGVCALNSAEFLPLFVTADFRPPQRMVMIRLFSWD